MSVALVVHGHFYQPPREDPWTGVVPEQPDAAPFHDWNERITAECYGPNTTVGVMGDDGQAFVVNTFEHLSFNVGPTLLSWLQEHHPEVYDRILGADAAAGRGIAQAYGHAILPLCNEHDLRTQVRWGIADFVHRFGRAPAGMWLPETAVSDAVLRRAGRGGDPLHDPGARPDRGRPAARAADDDAWQVHGLAEHEGLGPVEPEVAASGALDISRPVPLAPPRARRPGRRAGRLRRRPRPRPRLRPPHQRGHRADRRRARRARRRAGGGRHRRGDVRPPPQGRRARRRPRAHRRRGRAAGSPRRGCVDLLDERPPTHEARVRVSAWSCAHGVGRWKDRLRVPHRRRGGLEPGVARAAAPGARRAARLGRRPDGAAWAASCSATRGRRATTTSTCCSAPARWDDFAAEHIVGDGHRAGVLLDAQRNALLMYTSCGWFFNDLAGIETVQILRYAARAIDLYEQLGEKPPVDAVLDVLAQARSNDPAAGDGRRSGTSRSCPAEPRCWGTRRDGR